ncbi:hypothetical protein Y032_1046g3487 [Ancylostoma ceylanicum]|uniref:Secreted protein n=1 Tax=Ancylostoma ceylanicum TaxID=53326 RepID=A0A016W6K9_9BILA|nr:hypothetical protein Y032_1046g3487 [Ancylostoma ceylanicum]
MFVFTVVIIFWDTITRWYSFHFVLLASCKDLPLIQRSVSHHFASVTDNSKIVSIGINVSTHRCLWKCKKRKGK